MDITGTKRVWAGGTDVYEDDGDEHLVRRLLHYIPPFLIKLPCSHSLLPSLSVPVPSHSTPSILSITLRLLIVLGSVLCIYRSHGTYYFIAAGCHWSLGRYDEAQKLLDAIIGLLDKKKIGGKDLPTEVFIKKKCE